MIGDREAIFRLMNAYCLRMDAGDLEGFARLFERGRWQVLGAPADSGTAAVLRTLRNVILYEGRPLTKHVMSNVEIAIGPDGQRATAQCYITVFQAVPPDFPLQPIFAGHYRDRFERDGSEWHFAERTISPDLIGNLSRHRADMARG